MSDNVIENTIEDDIRAALAEIDGNEPEKPVKEPQEPVNQDKADTNQQGEPEAPTEPEKPKYQPPQGWTAEAKAKWDSIPPELQAEIARREDDIHKGFTRQEEEKTLGKQIKEVVAPYMAVIQAEGGTPVTAVRDLLNTAYVLRTAAPAQKAAMVAQIIDAYGVDMSLIGGRAPQDPSSEVQYLKQKVAQLEQVANPQTIEQMLQERLQHDKVMSEVQAFASDPAHKYYNLVKPQMAELLGTGRAGSMKEAYDMACAANPDISSMLAAQKQMAEDAKRKSELDAKRKASVSVSGSPAPSATALKTPQNASVEDDVRAAFEALRSSV